MWVYSLGQVDESSAGSNEYPLLELNSDFFVLLEPYSEFVEK